VCEAVGSILILEKKKKTLAKARIEKERSNEIRRKEK
jgi:hypothetical protein